VVQQAVFCGGWVQLVMSICHRVKDHATLSSDDMMGEWVNVDRRDQVQAIDSHVIRWHNGNVSSIVEHTAKTITVMHGMNRSTARFEVIGIGANLPRSSTQRRMKDRLEWDDGDIWVRKDATSAFIKEVRGIIKAKKEKPGSKPAGGSSLDVDSHVVSARRGGASPISSDSHYSTDRTGMVSSSAVPRIVGQDGQLLSPRRSFKAAVDMTQFQARLPPHVAVRFLLAALPTA